MKSRLLLSMVLLLACGAPEERAPTMPGPRCMTPDGRCPERVVQPEPRDPLLEGLRAARSATEIEAACAEARDAFRREVLAVDRSCVHAADCQVLPVLGCGALAHYSVDGEGIERRWAQIERACGRARHECWTAPPVCEDGRCAWGSSLRGK